MAGEQNTQNVIQENPQDTVETKNDSAMTNPAPCVYTTEPVIITQPGDNTDLSAIVVEPGKTYIFDFDPSVVQSAYQQDGDLIIKFTNNSSVTLQNFEGAFGEQFPPALTLADGTIVSATDLISTLTAQSEPAEELLEGPQSEIRASEAEDQTDGEGETDAQAPKVAKVEPAAGQDDMAEKLAQIETAAGDEGGNSGRGGFGFQSEFAAGPIDPLNDVGPIGPTALRYGVEFKNDILFLEEQPPGTPDDDPILVGPLTEFMDETNLGPLVDTGQIIADFGNDGPGTIGPNGSFVEGGSLLGGNLTSNGVPVVVTPTANGYEGNAGGTPVFTLVINPETGEYAFTLLEPLDHMDASNPNDEITLEFGVVATDNGGQTAQTTITVTVADDAPTANDDHNMYNVADGIATGDVIIGLNGGPGAADDLSNDLGNTVVKISFNGTVVDIPDGGSNVINGDFGQLEMFSDGSYTYTLFNPIPGVNMASLNPVAGDVAGIQSTITKNGITVTSENGADLAWTMEDGAGIGIAGGGSDKVWPAGETLEVDFAASDKVTVVIADIGANNLNGAIDFNVYLASDPGTPVPFLFDISTTTPVGGKITVELNSVDFGGQIVGFDVFATTKQTSFLLHDVKIESIPDCLQEQFGYVLQDGDGDTDPAILDLKGCFPPVVASIEVNNGVDDVQVKEDGMVIVPVTAGYSGGNGNEHLTLTLDGVDPSWGFSAAGWTPTGNPGQYELVLPVGQQNYAGNFTFTPPAQSDIDLNALSVVAVVSGPDATDNDSASDGFNIIVDAVADDPSVVADNGAVDEGQPIAINVAGMLGVDNFDGSESITGYQISGLPLVGFSFNQGTNLGGGVWAFTPAQIVGLTLTPADPNFFGTLNLVAKVLTTENPVSDNEYDFTDNNNMATDPFTLTWRPDGSPILVQPEIVTVDETNLAPTTQISDIIEADFGNDTPGSFSGNGGFFSAIPLTSDGDTVNVTFDAPTNTYTGKTVGGETIFTLVIQSDGNYTFKLEGVLDHPNASDPNDNIPMQFGMTATDSDGESTNGVITVNVLDDGPVAHSDMNKFAVTDGGSDGNVITGENGGAGAGDDLSKDVINKVTQVAFGGNTVIVPMVGTASIDGDFGTLEISSNGSYNYTLFSIPTQPSGHIVTNHLDVTAPDLAGTQNFIIKNGITVSSFRGDDLSWEDRTADGGGIGIGTSGNKVFGATDGLHVDFAVPVTSAMFDIADLHNNLTSGIDYTVYLTDGTSVQGEFNVGSVTVVGGMAAFTIDASTYGAAGIVGVDVYSVSNSALSTASFMLNNIWTESHCIEQVQLDIVPADLNGFQNTFTKNGITIESFLGDDLTFDDYGATGSGIGTNGGMWGPTDGVHVSFAESADTATFTIGELGSNNLDDGIDWIVYLSDGTSVQGEFDINTVTVIGGLASFTLNGEDFGAGLTIDQVDLFSVQNSSIGVASWILNNVIAGYECEDPKETHDVFQYTLTDNDGDSSTANLALWGSTTPSVIESAAGAEDLYGTAGADTFLYDSLADGLDTIHGFDATEGDVLDISSLLSQYNPLQDSINDFVFGTEAGGNTTIAVDVNGTGNIANATAIALIEGATGLDLEIITNDGQAAIV